MYTNILSSCKSGRCMQWSSPGCFKCRCSRKGVLERDQWGTLAEKTHEACFHDDKNARLMVHYYMCLDLEFRGMFWCTDIMSGITINMKSWMIWSWLPNLIIFVYFLVHTLTPLLSSCLRLSFLIKWILFG